GAALVVISYPRPGRLAGGKEAQRVGVQRFLLRISRAKQNAAVEELLLRGDRFEQQAIAVDLDHHEMVLRDADLVEVAGAEIVQLPTAADFDEVGISQHNFMV